MPGTQTLDRDGKLLLGGSSLLGLRRFHANGAPGTSFNPPRTSASTAFPLPDIRAVAAFPGGRILIGGSFSQIADIPRRALACFNSDGSLSPAYAARDDGCEAGAIVPRREVGGGLDEPVVFRIALDTDKRVGSLTAELNLSCVGVEQKDQTT